MSKYQEVYKAISDALGGEPMELVAPGAPTRPNKEPIYLYHPIHLEDVLRATGNVTCVMEGNTLSIVAICKDGVIRGSTYNLSLPFSEQSEELYQFLHDILCKKTKTP
jgi:hypothetical protein